MSTFTRSRTGRALVALTGLAAVAGISLSAPTTGPASADARSPIELSMPDTITAYYDGEIAATDQAAPTLLARDDDFVIKLRRSAWDQSIVATWVKPGADVTLPDGFVSMDQFGIGPLVPDFFRQVVRGPHRRVLSSERIGLCSLDVTERGLPGAAANDPYPQFCPSQPFTIGTVLGIPAGWRAAGRNSYSYDLKPGTYTLNTSITPKYRAMFGIKTADAWTSSRLVVTKGKAPRPHSSRSTRQTRPTQQSAAKPNPARPTGTAPTDPTELLPDLVPLPATWMFVNNGDYLKFGATVYNAGTSPLVVDGFVDLPGTMDAYQYFFDSAGNQIDYAPVGGLYWNVRHREWQLDVFTKFELLDANGDLVRESRKYTACVANTDLVDYTLPNANWRPSSTDRTTACGNATSRSVRERLDIGSGDTAYPSLSLKGLPNGTYFVAVTANPDGHVMETDRTNNTSLRKITIGGTPGERTVVMERVGKVVDDWE